MHYFSESEKVNKDILSVMCVELVSWVDFINVCIPLI